MSCKDRKNKAQVIWVTYLGCMFWRQLAMVMMGNTAVAKNPSLSGVGCVFQRSLGIPLGQVTSASIIKRNGNNLYCCHQCYHPSIITFYGQVQWEDWLSKCSTLMRNFQLRPQLRHPKDISFHFSALPVAPSGIGSQDFILGKPWSQGALQSYVLV